MFQILGFYFIIIHGFMLTHGLYEGCVYSQSIKRGGYFKIDTANQVGNATKNIFCRYVLKAPKNYHLKASCRVDVQDRNSCTNNYLFISKTGEEDLSGGDRFCGNTSVVATSLFQSMTIAYQVDDEVHIKCRVSAKKERSADCECGWSSTPKIAGGKDTGPQEFPSIVGLIVVEDPKHPCNESCQNSEGIGQNEIFCGGTIVSHSYVLSVATCILWYKPPGQLRIVAGQQYTDIGRRSKYSQEIVVESWKLLKTNVYYLSLLKLKTQIEWSRGVGPICLPYNFQNFNFVGLTLIMVGWGAEGVNKSRSSSLQKAYVPVISNEECKKIMPNIYSNEICTYGPPSGGCFQDTGGPVIYQRSRQYFIGSIGYRHECGEISKAGVNVQISKFLDWIGKNVDEKLCKRFT